MASKTLGERKRDVAGGAAGEALEVPAFTGWATGEGLPEGATGSGYGVGRYSRVITRSAFVLPAGLMMPRSSSCLI